MEVPSCKTPSGSISEEPLLFPPGRISTPGAVFLLCNFYVGAGILSMAYGFGASGYVGGSLAVVCVTVVMYVTAMAVHYSSLKVRNMMLEENIDQGSDSPTRVLSPPSFGDVVEKASGKTIALFTRVVYVIEIGFATAIYLIILGSSCTQIMHVFAPTFKLSSAVFIACAGVVLYALLFVPIQRLSFLSGVALVSIVVCVSTFVYTCIGESLDSHHVAHEHSIFRFDALFFSAGVWSTGLGAHPALPMIQAEMKHVDEFPRALTIAFFISATLYCLVGVLGYVTFGDDVSESFLDQVGHGLSYGSAVEVIACVCMIVKTVPAMPVTLRVVVDAFPIARRTSTNRILRHLIELLTAAVITVVAVLCRDHLADVMSFVGVILMTVSSIWMPVICYWKLCSNASLSKNSHVTTVSVLCVVMVFGAALVTLGTYQTAERLV